jgi:carbonic anhydrase
MNASRRLTAGLLVLAVSALVHVPATAGDDSTGSSAIRDRISRGVSEGLARHPAPATAPRPIPSRPAALPAKPATDASAATTDTRPDTPDAVWEDLVAGNARFVAGHPRPYPVVQERGQLVAAQHPRAILLACADSRVSPEIVFDQSLGDVFVVRTAGNIVDPIALGSIEYAVEHLHSTLLVVVGHMSCGAVKAAAAGGDMPSTHLQAIVDRIRPTVQRLSNCFEGDELIERSVIANARQSATDIVANSELIRTAVAHGELKVMSAVYDLRTGVVTSVTPPAATAQAQAAAH